MRSALCDWEEGTIFLAKCVEAEELGLNYAGLALEAALLACLGVAVAYAWRHCKVGRGEARTRRRRTLVGKARLDGGRAGSDIPSAAAQSAASARSTAAHCSSCKLHKHANRPVDCARSAHQVALACHDLLAPFLRLAKCSSALRSVHRARQGDLGSGPVKVGFMDGTRHTCPQPPSAVCHAATARQETVAETCG